MYCYGKRIHLNLFHLTAFAQISFKYIKCSLKTFLQFKNIFKETDPQGPSANIISIHHMECVN